MHHVGVKKYLDEVVQRWMTYHLHKSVQDLLLGSIDGTYCFFFKKKYGDDYPSAKLIEPRPPALT
jgi:hypothetical protein